MFLFIVDRSIIIHGDHGRMCDFDDLHNEFILYLLPALSPFPTWSYIFAANNTNLKVSDY